MGDMAMGERSEVFVREFGQDIEKAYKPDLGDAVVESFLTYSDESFEVRMRYVVKDRRGDEYLLESARVFFTPDSDLDACAEELAELFYPGNGEEHFDEVLIRLMLVDAASG